MEFKSGWYLGKSATAPYTGDPDFIWLDLYNFTVYGRSWHPTNSAYVGEWRRSPSNGYVDEVLMQWTNLPASGTIDTAEIVVTFDAQGTQTVSNTLVLLDQNKTAPGSWSNPPRYDDFSNPSWNTTIDSIAAVLNTGTYTFNGGTVKSTIQNWIDNPSQNWGAILELNFGAIDWWLRVSQITMNLTFL